MTKNDSADGNNAGKKVKPKKKKTLLVVLLCLLILAGSAAATYFYLNRGDGAETGDPASLKKDQLEVLDMGEMIVNLAGGHYLRTKIVLEHPANKKLAEELKKKKHKVSDTLISSLRGKSLSDINSPDSIENLKASLLAEINSHLTNGKVTGIYFTDFLVQ